MSATLRATLIDAITREAPRADHDLLADAILAVANGTHGMPKTARRRLVSFAVTGLVEANARRTRAGASRPRERKRAR